MGLGDAMRISSAMHLLSGVEGSQVMICRDSGNPVVVYTKTRITGIFNITQAVDFFKSIFEAGMGT